MLGPSEQLHAAGIAAWSRGGKQSDLSPVATPDEVTPCLFWFRWVESYRGEREGLRDLRQGASSPA